jgi:hypothetical protein
VTTCASTAGVKSNTTMGIIKQDRATKRFGESRLGGAIQLGKEWDNIVLL